MAAFFSVDTVVHMARVLCNVPSFVFLALLTLRHRNNRANRQQFRFAEPLTAQHKNILRNTKAGHREPLLYPESRAKKKQQQQQQNNTQSVQFYDAAGGQLRRKLEKTCRTSYTSTQRRRFSIEEHKYRRRNFTETGLGLVVIVPQ